MNERIEKLAEQAGVTGYFAAGTKLATPIPLSPEMEKFAELIVQECVDCADFVGQVNIASGYPNSTAHHVKQKIKQHFGVDE